ncbi:bud emergence protein 1 [Malassezia psittaci]|uniref:Bud emergence protein 1 n=1 Tax=Malassezia psittaci TaxID=1821823 RepID=A0AAF0JIC9_9BASI|nr:bud emergence protein 1 [Malassezia psittaci]
MKSLKDLRMTLRDKPSSSSRSASTPAGSSKHVSSLQPPKQVIRAAKAYESQNPSELSFHSGDFFHVVTNQRADLQPGWIEVCNPMTNARGVVPESHFDILQRSSPAVAFNLTTRSELNPNGSTLPAPSGAPIELVRARSASMGSTPSSWFATVKHDFVAERSQELDAKEGDSLLIVARSDMDWLVAKPLGRLGLPGLIPAGFIVFRDTVTGEPVPEQASYTILERLPSVQEWQKKNERYRQNAIPLGKLDYPAQDQSSLTKTRNTPLPPLPNDASPLDAASSTPNSQSSRAASTTEDSLSASQCGDLMQSVPSSPSFSNARMARSSAHDHSLTQSMHFLPAGLMTGASVDALHYEPNDYWYRLRVSYVSTLTTMQSPEHPQGHEIRDLVLYRLYEDFVEFHMSLAQELMGSNPANDSLLLRSLPALPPPCAQIDERAAARRRSELDVYLRQLLTCPEQVLRSAPVRGFLELRPGDRCRTSVSTSKLRTSRGSNTDSSNALDFDLPSRLQSLNTAHNLRRDSPIDPYSPSPSSNRNSDTYSTSDSTPYYRVKVARIDDPTQVFAIRMPTSFTYQSLLHKIQTKLGSELQAVYLDESQHLSVNTNELVQKWIHESVTQGKKLFLYAGK